MSLPPSCTSMMKAVVIIGVTERVNVIPPLLVLSAGAPLVLVTLKLVAAPLVAPAQIVNQSIFILLHALNCLS